MLLQEAALRNLNEDIIVSLEALCQACSDPHLSSVPIPHGVVGTLITTMKKHVKNLDAISHCLQILFRLCFVSDQCKIELELSAYFLVSILNDYKDDYSVSLECIKLVETVAFKSEDFVDAGALTSIVAVLQMHWAGREHCQVGIY